MTAAQTGAQLAGQTTSHARAPVHELTDERIGWLADKLRDRHRWVGPESVPKDTTGGWHWFDGERWRPDHGSAQLLADSRELLRARAAELVAQGVTPPKWLLTGKGVAHALRELLAGPGGTSQDGSADDGGGGTSSGTQRSLIDWIAAWLQDKARWCDGYVRTPRGGVAPVRGWYVSAGSVWRADDSPRGAYLVPMAVRDLTVKWLTQQPDVSSEFAARALSSAGQRSLVDQLRERLFGPPVGARDSTPLLPQANYSGSYRIDNSHDHVDWLAARLRHVYAWDRSQGWLRRLAGVWVSDPGGARLLWELPRLLGERSDELVAAGCEGLSPWLLTDRGIRSLAIALCGPLTADRAHRAGTDVPDRKQATEGRR
jgi:hypothetical protein